MKKTKISIALLSLVLTLPIFASEPLAPLFRNCYNSKGAAFKMSLGPIGTGLLKMVSKEFKEIGVRSISIAVFEDFAEMQNNEALTKLRKQSTFSDFPLLTLIKDDDAVVKVFGKEDGDGFIKNMYLAVFDVEDKDVVLLHLKGKISLDNISKITTSTQDKYGR